MKAMILAAGLGQRMRPLTDHLPKPMLLAGGKPLLQYHLEALAALGASEVIINLAYLGDKIREFVGDGSSSGLGSGLGSGLSATGGLSAALGIKVRYSEEPEPLETAGALLHALPLLGSEPFLLINGDVWSDYPLAQLASYSLQSDEDARLVLVPNPEFHPEGDFALNAQGRLTDEPTLAKFTFGGISLIHPRLIHNYPHQRTKFPLGEVLRFGIAQGRISASVYRGGWSDVGTPARLDELETRLRSSLARRGSAGL